MSLAPYFERANIAASQILAGYDPAQFRAKLECTSVGVGFGPSAITGEGRNAVEIVVRLIARLYPRISLHPAGGAELAKAELEALARSINPNIEFGSNDTHTIVVGDDSKTTSVAPVFIGSKGWDARLSRRTPRSVGATSNPFGAGAAAALGCAEIFREIFGLGTPSPDVILSTFHGTAGVTSDAVDPSQILLPERTLLVGLGAIGNAAFWALIRSGVQGTLHLVDDEHVDLGNLQRYLLATMPDIGKSKTEHLASHASGPLSIVPVGRDFAAFVAANGYQWGQALVALDSAADRRTVQASLPRRIVNAWTQPEDLGVSEHGAFGSGAACLCCLYQPRSRSKNRDELIAEALRIPDRTMQVRELLESGVPVPVDFIADILAAFRLPPADVKRFAGMRMDQLYRDGLCGGMLVPFDSVAEAARGELHVPVAHQSCLAGILLAAAAIRQVVRITGGTTSVTRIDLRRPLAPYPTTSERAVAQCICGNRAYRHAYQLKYAALA